MGPALNGRRNRPGRANRRRTVRDETRESRANPPNAGARSNGGSAQPLDERRRWRGVAAGPDFDDARDPGRPGGERPCRGKDAAPRTFDSLEGAGPLPADYGSRRAGAYKSPRHFVRFRSLRKFRPDSNAAAESRPGLQFFAGDARYLECAYHSSPNPKPVPPRPARSRFGYDHRWWGESAAAEADERSYWATTRRPLPCLVFVAAVPAGL